jgi:hypothetical protein
MSGIACVGCPSANDKSVRQFPIAAWRARERPVERLAQEVDVIDEKTQAALSQIGREEKAAAADEVSPIVRHRASIAQQKVMGFAEPVIGPATSGRTRWLNPSYGLPLMW